MATAGTASADPPPRQENFKVFVCKYVSTPRVSELLQGGGNPLSVSVNAIPNLVDGNGDPIPWTTGNVVGHEFADAHGQSLVISVDNTAPGPEGDPSADQCPRSNPQPTSVTPTVNFSDPCGTANDTFNVVADPTKFTFGTTGTPAGGTVTITFTALPGFTIGGANPRLLTFTNVACPSGPTLISPLVSFAEPTCVNPSRSRINLGNQNAVGYTVVGSPGPGNSVSVNAAPKSGFEFPAGTDAAFEHTFKTIESLNCPTDEPTVGGTETTRPRPDNKPEAKPDGERPPVVLGTQAGVPSAVAAGLPGSPTSESGSSALLVSQLMVGTGLVLLLAGGWLGMGARRVRTGVHQV